MTNTLDAYCVMGNPVAHSRSLDSCPLCRTDRPALSYDRALVPLDGFADFVRDFAARGGKGCNVTVPFKLQAAELATSASERVRLAGAANTLVFSANGIHADNTDGLGIVADITRNAGVAITGRDVLLLGAGGAAAGALGSLIEQQPHRIVVTNRTQAKAVALIEQHAAIAAHKVELVALERQVLETDLTQNFDIIINATASSLAGADVPARQRAARTQSGLRHDVWTRRPEFSELGQQPWRTGA
jgi:shikimate dehydrogenase